MGFGVKMLKPIFLTIRSVLRSQKSTFASSVSKVIAIFSKQTVYCKVCKYISQMTFIWA